MFRATGPGTIRLDRRSSRESHLIWFHLDNFDVDGVALKTEHRNVLTRIFRHNMVESGGIIMPVDRIWVFLRGYASRAGGAAHNIDLSRQRVANVRQYLNAYVSDDHITGLQHVGEDWSHSEIEEDENFRSVEVICTTENTPPLPPRPAFIYDRFRMRAKPVGGQAVDALAQGLDLAGHALPTGLGATFLLIQIERRSNHARKFFLFYSGQVSAGLSAPSFMFAQPNDFGELGGGYGDWVNFRTRSHDHHVAFTEFEGSASFGSLASVQIGLQDAGDSFFEFKSELMHSVEHWVNILPRTIVLPMPMSNGLGFSLASFSMAGHLVALD
jgi:hypothetical protein